MLNLLITILVIFSLLIGWITIEQFARKFAAKHPELGPVKEEGLGCGKHCGCQAGHCRQDH